MKIKKLRLKGFTGVKRGMGLDEIEIDFSNVDGLVAFSGQNGTGKSSVLENLGPYPRLASRNGALYQHVFTRDAERELSFEYQGDDYRILLKVDNQSGRSEGYIWRNGESIVNGKIRDYTKKVTEIFGSPELFYNSVFTAQNATKLNEMTTGELKGLFAEFLRLDRLQGYEETCKAMINVLSGKASQIDLNISALSMRLESSRGIKDQISRLAFLKTENEAHLQQNTLELSTAQSERARLTVTIARNEELKKKTDEMFNTIRTLKRNRDDEGRQIEEQLTKLRTQYQQLQKDIAEADGILASEASIHAHAENKKALEELIESMTANLEQAAESVTTAQKAVTELEKGVQELKNSLKMTEKDKTLSDIDWSISSLSMTIGGYNDQLKALDQRHPECAINGCSFIVAAIQAQEALPEAQDRLNQLKIDRENRMAELKAAATEISGQIAEKESALKDARYKLTVLTNDQTTKRQDLAVKRRELAQYQNVAEKQAALAVANSKKEDRLKALEENKAQGQAISEAWGTKKKTLDDQIEELTQVFSSIRIDTEAEEKLTACNYEIDRTTKEIREVEKSISETTSAIARLQGELSGMKEAEEQLQKASEEKIRVSANIADWTYIKNACGKNGLQAMEIDGAAPIITGFANDLLSQAFGSLYTVKFRTQDDEGKECLDIITITDDGEEVLLDNLSGGQRTWILMALRLAMTLLSKEKGGRNFQTAFFDELDGPLDADNAVNFVHLYKSFMQIGHFDTVPFISHKQECRNLADHVLMFEAGKNPYWN